MSRPMLRTQLALRNHGGCSNPCLRLLRRYLEGRVTHCYPALMQSRALKGELAAEGLSNIQSCMYRMVLHSANQLTQQKGAE